LDRVRDHVRAGGTIPPFETVRVRKDGHKFVAAVTISRICDEAGRLVGASAATRDITEQKRAEQLVRRSEARFRHLFENAADGILLLDRRGTILDANPAGAMLLGARDPGALRGINLGELLPARELEKARSYLRALLAEDPTAIEKLENSREQRRCATNIVEELVAITRSDEVRRIETDVRGVVEAAADQAIAFRQGKVSLVKELPKDPVMANVDPLRLQ